MGTSEKSLPIEEMAKHVDHEMSRLLWIGETLRWHLLLPDTVVRALRVAYAAHARALLEFFHDGRSGRVGKRGTHDSDVDVWLSDYMDKEPGTYDWKNHLVRFSDADKLLAHLSTGRLAPDRAQRPEWGDLDDRVWVREVIMQIKTALTDARRWDWFPETERALAETRS